jgi:nucleotide-binding universal stress UspA family protein
MEERLLHVFRNTPLGRETLLQSLYFCNTLGTNLHIYIPRTTQFLMYFDHDAVQVDLDDSYLTMPTTAEEHARQLAEQHTIKPVFLSPKNYTASQLPDIATNFNYMCCPRSISDLSSKIGLGYIGPKVRRIVKSSAFPVLITSPSFKEWKSICVFYGGSKNADKALSLGIALSIKSGYPLDMFTHADGRDAAYFNEQLEKAGLLDKVQNYVRTWHKVSEGNFEESLYTVGYDALLVVGAYGHGLIKDFFFGSKMETIQSWMPNNILLVGPNCIYQGT